MKLSTITAITAVLGISQTSAFTIGLVTRQSSATSNPLRAAELTPEPEGGEELTKISSSLEGSRMKNMGADEEGEEGVYKFWLTATADGALVKKLRVQTEKEASRKANFPGFRKGQVPPYAQPQITGFAVQEVSRALQRTHVNRCSFIYCPTIPFHTMTRKGSHQNM